MCRRPLLHAALHGCADPCQLCHCLSCTGTSCCNLADRPLESSSQAAQSAFERSPARHWHLGGDSRRSSYGNWPKRASAGKALALLRLRCQGTPYLSYSARSFWPCELYRRNQCSHAHPVAGHVERLLPSSARHPGLEAASTLELCSIRVGRNSLHRLPGDRKAEIFLCGDRLDLSRLCRRIAGRRNREATRRLASAFAY